MVLAPGAVAAGARRTAFRITRRRLAWAAPTAVAAGFVAVAGVLVVMREPASLAPSGPAARLAEAPAAGAGPAVAAAPTAVQPVAAEAPERLQQPRVANGQLIRDAGLDRYLAAHRNFVVSGALGLQPTFVRSATVDVPGR